MVRGLRVAFVKVILLWVLILQLGVSAVNGMDYGAKPKPVMPSFLTATAVNKAVGLELTVQLEKVGYNLGEPVNITFTLANISNKTINLWLESDSSWDYQVFNSTNYCVFDYLIDYPIWGAVGMPVQIAAEKNLTLVFVWPQAYGQIPPPWVSPRSAVIPVSPGSYYIVGRFSNSNFTLQTPPLQIIIGYIPLLVWSSILLVGSLILGTVSFFAMIILSLIQEHKKK